MNRNNPLFWRIENVNLYDLRHHRARLAACVEMNPTIPSLRLDLGYVDWVIAERERMTRIRRAG